MALLKKTNAEQAARIATLGRIIEALEPKTMTPLDIRGCTV